MYYLFEGFGHCHQCKEEVPIIIRINHVQKERDGHYVHLCKSCAEDVFRPFIDTTETH